MLSKRAASLTPSLFLSFLLLPKKTFKLHLCGKMVLLSRFNLNNIMASCHVRLCRRVWRTERTIVHISEPLEHKFIGVGERVFPALKEVHVHRSLTLSCPAWTLHSAECGHNFPTCTAHAVLLRRSCTTHTHQKNPKTNHSS